MKKNTLKPAVLGSALALALLAVPTLALAQAAPPADPAAPVQAGPEKPTLSFTGKVTDKTATTLTVGGRTVTLTSATTCAKDGASIGSADIKVGDTVSVVTTDDGMVAVSVNVTVSS